MARPLFHIVCALAAVLLLRAADAQTLAPYKIVADGIPESLTGTPGDAVQGRKLEQEI